MTKYLDENGLAYFWTKIKNYVADHAGKYFGANWIVDSDDDYALVVGNGNDSQNPSNSAAITHDGKLVEFASGIDNITIPVATEYFDAIEMFDEDGNRRMVIQVSNIDDGCQGAVLKAQRHVNNDDVYNSVDLRIDPSGNKIVAFDDNDSKMAWLNALGAISGIWPISLGGSGMSGVQVLVQETGTAQNVITPASGVTIAAAYATVWGKVVYIRFEWKRNATFSVSANGDIGDFTIGTLKQGLRPRYWGMWVSGQQGDKAIGHYLITGDGYVKITGFGCDTGAYTVAANTTFYMSACFLVG